MKSELLDKDNVEFSIIIPYHNELHFTSQALQSIKQHTSVSYELILVDNGSTDSLAQLLQPQIRFKKNRGFAVACNAGIKIAKGDYIVLLNNDVIVTPNWLVWMREDLERAASQLHLPYVGLVGPVSNAVAPAQQVDAITNNLDHLPEAAIEYHRRHKGNLTATSFLSGFCLVIKKEVIEKVGYFDEQFTPGGFEDNDFCARCLEHGIHMIISQSVYVHHFGGRTFKSLKVDPLVCRVRFLSKWKNRLGQKLVAMYRVRNDIENFRRSLENVSERVDEIVVFDDRSTDPIDKLVQRFPKVVAYHKKPLGAPFAELEDRQTLLRMALKRAPDWILSIDSDELFEEKVNRAYLERIMGLPEPIMRAVLVHFYTCWDSEKNWRADGIFGRMCGPRLFRATPKQNLFGGTKEGLHCPHLPADALASVSLSPIKLVHLGYVQEENRRRKFEWYEGLDSDKRAELIGAESYKHLVDKLVELRPFQNQTYVLCTMSPGMSDRLYEMILRHYVLFDEIWVLNTKPKDSMQELERLLSPIKIENFAWRDDFSAARNFLLESAEPDPNRWIIWLDPDEQLTLPMHYIRAFETDHEMLLFDILEFLPETSPVRHQLIRAHRHIPEVRFHNRVHENFDQARKLNPWLRVKEVPFVVCHYGYLSGPENLRKKFELYKRLIALEMQENPNAAQPHFDLALHLFDEGRIDEGAMELAACLDRDPSFFEARRELGLWHLQEALECFTILSQDQKTPRYLREGCSRLLERLRPLVPPRRSLLRSGKP